MSKTKQHLDNIEIVDTPDIAFFEVRMVVAMDEYDEAEPITGSEWLLNLLSLASEGVDIKYPASEFIRSMVTIKEKRIHLCTVERIEA